VLDVSTATSKGRSAMSTTSPGPVATRNNGYGIAAMVLGIVAVVASFNGFFFITLPLAVAAGVLAIVFGILGRRRVQRGEADNAGQALAGIILGPIAILLVAAGVAFVGFGPGWQRGADGPWDRFDHRVEAEPVPS
jgi:uncharacterized protein DUF4190